MGHFLERFYPYAPLWFQNLGISLFGLAYKQERLGGDFEHQVAEFTERECWRRMDMEAYVDQELRRTLLHAFDQVPYYSLKWREAGLVRNDLAGMRASDLPKIPLTSKEDLRENPDQFVAGDVRRAKRLHHYHSSGSTGTPITSICTADAHRRFIAAREARSFAWAGTSIRMRRSMLGGRMIVPKGDAPPPYYRYNRAEKQVYFSAYHVSPNTAPNYVEGFQRHRPQLLTGYAHSHYLLARIMLESELRLDYSPQAIVLSSEKLTSEMKIVIQKALRARAYEEYGAVENCVLATECSHGRLHISPDFGVLEIVDDNGEPTPAGKEGRVVCTGLLNDAQPLIRYDIGDIATLSEDACSCGRDHFPVLKEVVGRLEDVVVGPDGREINRFHGVFIGLPHVIAGQIVQEERDLIRVNVVPARGFDRQDDALIRRRIAVERLPGMRIDIRLVENIERTERGKFRAVISRVPRPNVHANAAGSGANR